VTTTFLLVRHAAPDNIGAFLAGRDIDMSLGEAGRTQAARLAERHEFRGAIAIYTSPRKRTRETAAAIGARIGLREQVSDDLDEIDFGTAWTGKAFAELHADPGWQWWNEDRGAARTPAGESLEDVRRRIGGHIVTAMHRHSGGTVVLVSHADVIKAAVTRHIGLPLDAIDRMEISPASITTLAVGDWGAKLVHLNVVL